MTPTIEQLEPRNLVAVASFSFNLYEDNGGTPGPLITDDTVEVSDSFFVEIMARELHPLNAGLRGVALDIAWDPNVFEEIDSPFNPKELITPNLPMIWGGTLDNQAGTIDNLAASARLSSSVGRAIGNLYSERFAILHFRALEPAETSSFSMNQGRSRIVTVPVSSLGSDSINFETQTITVVDAASVDAAWCEEIADDLAACLTATELGQQPQP